MANGTRTKQWSSDIVYSSMPQDSRLKLEYIEYFQILDSSVECVGVVVTEQQSDHCCVYLLKLQATLILGML